MPPKRASHTSETIADNESITLSALTTALTKLREDFNQDMKKEINNLRADMLKEIESLRAVINKQEKEIICLRNTVSTYALKAEKIEEKACESNIIIQGIPESCQDLKVEINSMLSQIGHQGCLNQPFRLGKSNGSRPRPVKITVTSKNEKIKIVKDAFKKFPGRYFNYDEPFLTRKENNRLRKKYKELNNAEPDKYKLAKGLIKDNSGAIIDRFDLKNQTSFL